MNWDQKTFRVMNWSRNQDGSCDLVLKEDSEAAYDDPLESDYTIKGGQPIVTPDPKVPVPSSLTATSVPVGIRLDWSNPDSGLFQVIEVFESQDSAWANAVKIGETKTTTFTSVLSAGTERWYWVRAKRMSGRVSTRNPDSDTSTVTATAGPIETGDIESEGVTTIATTTVASDNFFGGSEWINVTVPAQDTTYTMIVTTTFDCWADPDTFAFVRLLVKEDDETGTQVAGTDDVEVIGADSSGTRKRVAMQIEFDASASQAYYVAVLAQASSGTSEWNLRAGTLRVEGVKR